ncbi:unnamed protein product, partial [marine sediment metagenome]
MASINPPTNIVIPESDLRENKSDWDLVINTQHNLLNIPFS